VKATAAATAGALTVMESVVRQGPPRHVHAHEDECFYVLEGTVTGTCGDEAFEAGPRSFVFLPRGLAHTFRAAEGEARVLLIAVPGGIEHYFDEINNAVSAAEQERIGTKYGIRVVLAAPHHRGRPRGPRRRARPPVTCPPATFFGHYHLAKARGQTETVNSPAIPTAPATPFLISWHAAPTGELWALRRAAPPPRYRDSPELRDTRTAIHLEQARRPARVIRGGAIPVNGASGRPDISSSAQRRRHGEHASGGIRPYRATGTFAPFSNPPLIRETYTLARYYPYPGPVFRIPWRGFLVPNCDSLVAKIIPLICCS
jgi:mannose-6-phosphate isomerase-like protein (cupin superfamily)